jgi:hypothetical protein
MFSKRLSGVAVAIGLGVSVLPARAAYVVDLRQVGKDVVATGTGEIDLSALTFLGVTEGAASLITPSDGNIITGPAPFLGDEYSGITGPARFGGGFFPVFASSGSGDVVGVFFGNLIVPHGYVSGAPLSDTARYSGQTFASLSVTPGIYIWTWGSGANADSFTLDAVVPEPSTWVMMLVGFAGLGLAAWSRRRKAISSV